MVSFPAAHQLWLSIRTIHLQSNLKQPQKISRVNESIEHKVAHPTVQLITLMRHILLLDLRVTHRGLEWSMFAMRIWQCIDCIDYLQPHLHTNSP
jgi:hypothetical protein